MEGEAGGGYAGLKSGGSVGETATAASGGRGGLAHLADFKWWIGLTAIGLGRLKHMVERTFQRGLSIKSHEYSLSLSYCTSIHCRDVVF